MRLRKFNFTWLIAFPLAIAALIRQDLNLLCWAVVVYLINLEISFD